MKFIFILGLQFLVQFIQAQIIVPYPAEWKPVKGKFHFDKNTTIIVNDNLFDSQALYLKETVKLFYNIDLKIKKNKFSENNNCIIINISNQDSIKGAYTLTISPENIFIQSGNAEGIFYGIQSLLQLIPAEHKSEFQISCVHIKDHPQFEYRGMHLDVSRHFFDVDYVKKYIDLLAYHKFNKFHWHLTDDQGWRIDIKKYPLLTAVGSCRAQTLVGRFGSDVYDGKMHKGYYTQAQIKEVVQYAAERFITVIPEIDIPGHSLAALAAYPFLGCTKGPYKVRETWAVQPDIFCAGNDSTYTFIEQVMDEVMQLFPSEYIHIGGDESPKERWKNCPVCQNKIKTTSLKDEHALQSYFVQRVEKYLNSKGRKIIGWDEILEGGLAPNAAVMSWRGMKGGIAAAKLLHPVIMTPEDPLYLNLTQSKNEDSVTQGGYNPLEKVYAFNPVPNVLDTTEKKYIKGLQGEMWTEYISNPAKLEYMLFPRMAAIAEVAWTITEQKNFVRFENNLSQLMKRYDFWKVNYSTAYYDIQSSVIPVNNKIAWKLETRKKGNIVYRKNKDAEKIYTYTDPLIIDTSGNWSAGIPDSIHSKNIKWISQDFKLNKASGKKIVLVNLPNPKYSGQGGFTLIDGIQNNSGMLHANEFLGFIGSDLEAIIDLGQIMQVDSVTLHCFEQKPSWIYSPSSVEFSTSVDSLNFTVSSVPIKQGYKNLLYSSIINKKVRYIKVKAVNNGIISNGLPGAGSKAWLFADEIEIL